MPNQRDMKAYREWDGYRYPFLILVRGGKRSADPWWWDFSVGETFGTLLELLLLREGEEK